MIDNAFEVATFDDRPFLEKALRYGVQQGIISDEKIQTINTEAPKGIVQIATAFGSPYLRDEIELARFRIVNLVSLYLFETSGGDLESAARLIRDNTFLTLSRGGSTLLKELFALPEYALLGPNEHGRVEDFLEFWSRKKTSKDYQSTLQQRKLNQLEIRLAKKLGAALGLKATDYQDQHCEADALIRSAILLRLEKTGGKSKPVTSCFDQIGFAGLLDKMRKKGAAKTAKLDADFTADEKDLIAHLQQDILTNDLPRIIDESIPLDTLISQLKGRYFMRGHDLDDVAAYEALVSKEWTKYTKGKSDIDAIFTLLLCIAAKIPGKTSITVSAARTLIKKVRTEGFYPEMASEFIKNHAPHEKQESLLEDWEEFCEQAQLYLLDDWDHDFQLAMKFLRENCYIEKSAKSQ
ncbi:hypothetical protein AAKU67_002018 [Oxalobacteraceae bacterium GrIS 2.11]